MYVLASGRIQSAGCEYLVVYPGEDVMGGWFVALTLPYLFYDASRASSFLVHRSLLQRTHLSIPGH